MLDCPNCDEEFEANRIVCENCGDKTYVIADVYGLMTYASADATLMAASGKLLESLAAMIEESKLLRERYSDLDSTIPAAIAAVESALGLKTSCLTCHHCKAYSLYSLTAGCSQTYIDGVVSLPQRGECPHYEPPKKESDRA
jgi:hypothetical protein